MNNTNTYHRSPNHDLGDYDIDGETYTFHDVIRADGTALIVDAATRAEAFAAAWAEVDR